MVHTPLQHCVAVRASASGLADWGGEPTIGGSHSLASLVRLTPGYWRGESGRLSGSTRQPTGYRINSYHLSHSRPSQSRHSSLNKVMFTCLEQIASVTCFMMVIIINENYDLKVSFSEKYNNKRV
ncbi:hypothetical protein XENOCAPTIV_005818 [Xenoophorus captivus]|uniref:Uncharacterized protein n=1 Tax=Xenoophorus captivus TaxID=1517983 RepID=A0ABV0R3D4_9TELE